MMMTWTTLVGLVNLLICCLTFSIICLWLYMSITKKIYIINLTSAEFYEYYPYLQKSFIITLMGFLILTVILGIQMYIKKYKSKTEETRKGMFTKLSIKINQRLQKINIFVKTYGILFNNIDGEYTQYIVTFAKIVLDLSKKVKYIIIFSFVTLPRIIIIVLLLIEIYKGEIHYYFYSLLLLLIPLIFRFLIFILSDIGPRAYPQVKPMVVMQDFATASEVEVQTSEGLLNCKHVGFKLAPGYEDIDLTKFLQEYYFPLLFIGPHMEDDIKPFYSKINLVTKYIYYLLHCIALGYILYLLN